MKEQLPRPGSGPGVTELNSLARDCLQRQAHDEARHYLELSLLQEKTAETYRLLGMTWAVNRELEKAVEFFDKALELNEEDTETIAAMGDAYVYANDPLQAIGYYMLAIQMAPGVPGYKERFVAVAGSFPLEHFNKALEDTIVECLKTPGLDCAGVLSLWYAILVSKQLFQHILPPGHNITGRFDPLKLDELKDFTPLLEPYFLLGLKRLFVARFAFEEFLTFVRRLLLDELDAVPAIRKLSPEQHLALAEALAHYCFLTEYIFDCAAPEKIKVEALRMELEKAFDPAAEKNRLMVYACYAPLYSLKNHEKISAALRHDPLVSEIVAAQIDDLGALQQGAAALQAITPIENTVSGRVQEQYEEFPYPRWVHLPNIPLIHEVSLQGHLRKKELDVLTAGCGTGREAAWLASTLPQARVLAVDLSRASLAYAESKARRFNLNNVVFRQADILGLAKLDKKFDIISCAGVLHHMEDPIAGWRVLAGLLKADGMMRIALYSEKARRYFVEAMNVISEEQYPSTAEGIRRFRRDAPSILPGKIFSKLLASVDYYSMSACRDLLFHVQEHRFDIPAIRDVLDRLGLSFVQMSRSDLQEKYSCRFPDDQDGTKLDHWQTFEAENPDAFKGMYQFWCKKKV